MCEAPKEAEVSMMGNSREGEIAKGKHQEDILYSSHCLGNDGELWFVDWIELSQEGRAGVSGL